MSSQNFIISEEFDQTRLDVYLTKVLSNIPSRSFVQKLIQEAQVKVNGKIVKSHFKVSVGDQIDVDMDDSFMRQENIEAEDIKLNIFYEDDQLIIVHKPIGMLVHPATGRHSGTLVNALLGYANSLSNINTDIRPGIVHRLDEDTSGLMVVAKDNITHTKLAKQFQRHTVFKKYVALVKGDVEFDEGKINAPIDRHPRQRDKKSVQFSDKAKESITFYRVIKRFKDATLIGLYPKTGRTHQLRVHMSYLKHPILGDPKYGDKRTFSRLALHAQCIGFQHPKTKHYVEFSTRIPESFLNY